MSLTNEIIKQRLIEKFGDQAGHFEEPYGMLTFEAPNGTQARTGDRNSRPVDVTSRRDIRFNVNPEKPGK